ncbi:MAG: hypothetical protein JSV52_09330 [Candidatus Zixiibacteriota bacterium]|nr:MAG: hypothetical protein JSV52_09330 [candidate division Zixibacteria bacterium]
MKGKHGNRYGAPWRLIAPLVAILSLAVIFGLPGCSDQPLDVNTSQEDVSFFDLPFDEAIAKKGLEYDAVFGTEDYIAAEDGGTIAINGHGAIWSFQVFPNSIPNDVRITVRIYIVEDTPEKTTVIYEFGPDGLEFSVPALLTLDADAVAGTNGQTIDFYYLNKNRWVYQGTFNRTGDDEFVIPIHHFSRYGSGR